MRPVGIVGASGGVGRAAARRLAAWGAGPFRLGGRRIEPLHRLIDEELGGAGEAVAVDVECAGQLAAFCAGCRVVVDCAGPSRRLLDRVCRAAVEAGASCVSAGGDEAAHERLSPGIDTGGPGVVLSAGMMPGLSGVLPRCLASGLDRAVRLTAHAGGLGRLTPAGAADYLAGAAESAAPPRLQPALRDVDLPPFPGRVTALPYLSPEIERVARSLGVEEVRWYQVFDGAHLPAALARLQGAPPEAAAELALAADLDLFGRRPYQLMVVQLDGEAGGAAVSRTAILRAGGGIELTGAVTALVARAVLDGEIPSGLHYAADALAPAEWWSRLRALPEIETLSIAEGAAADVVVEEGVL